MLRSLASLNWPMALKSFSPAQPSGRTGRGSAISTFAIVFVVVMVMVVGEARLGEKKFGFGAALAVALVYRTLILAHRLNPSPNGPQNVSGYSSARPWSSIRHSINKPVWCFFLHVLLSFFVTQLHHVPGAYITPRAMTSPG